MENVDCLQGRVETKMDFVATSDTWNICIMQDVLKET